MSSLAFKIAIVYLAFVNVITFCAFGIDKHKAKQNRWRIPEGTLMGFAAIGGSIGAIIGMKAFHHKTQKKKFNVGVPVIIVLQILVIGYAAYQFGFKPSEDVKVSDITENVFESVREDFADATSDEGAKEENLINPDGNTLEERILVPDGFTRTTEEENSLGAFLRSYQMEEDGSPILLYNGGEKTGHAAAVFTMHLGDKDLQQCADSVMRVYAEYLRSVGADEKIAFHFVSGFLCDWNTYKSGKRITVDGNNVSWKDWAKASDSDETFEGYLNTVFNYASTLSLEKESYAIDESEIRIGDIFIKGGSPGHVVMVVDTCEKDGQKLFLLAQGFMPAQQFHVLTNEDHKGNPWYAADEISYPFITPEYVFDEGSLMRPGYLD